MRALYWVLTAILAIALMLFSVSNRQTVSLGLWPFAYVLDAPLYLATLVSLLIGLVLGVVASWVSGHRRRRQAREDRRRIAALERELTETQARLDQPSEPVGG